MRKFAAIMMALSLIEVATVSARADRQISAAVTATEPAQPKAKGKIVKVRVLKTDNGESTSAEYLDANGESVRDSKLWKDGTFEGRDFGNSGELTCKSEAHSTSVSGQVRITFHRYFDNGQSEIQEYLVDMSPVPTGSLAPEATIAPGEYKCTEDSATGMAITDDKGKEVFKGTGNGSTITLKWSTPKGSVTTVQDTKTGAYSVKQITRGEPIKVSNFTIKARRSRTRHFDETGKCTKDTEYDSQGNPKQK